MSELESKPLPRTDADAVSLDLVWAAAYAAVFTASPAAFSGVDSGHGADFAVKVADRAVAALVKRRAR